MNAKDLKKLSQYTKLSKELHQNAAISRVPINGAFELTERCNLNCSMCYICSSRNNIRKINNEICSGTWIEIGKMAKENGTLFLLITGGEVFIRPDFFDIYMPLSKMGFFITLFTNGTLITEDIAIRLSDAPPLRTEITLYGSNEKTYESVTRVKGSFKACCEGIERLIKYKVPISLKSTIVQENRHDLDAMWKMANSMGISFRAGWLIFPRRDGTRSSDKISRLSAKDCIEIENSDLISLCELTEIAIQKPKQVDNIIFKCLAGKAAYVINSKGKMNICLAMDIPETSLDDGFGNAWNELQRIVDNAPPINEICFTCIARDYCSICPAMSFLENGSLNSPVPYICDIAFKRKGFYESL